MPKGVSIKDVKLRQRVLEDDPEMSARAWNRALKDVYTKDNLIGYATFMGPGAATSLDNPLGWPETFCKFQSSPVYVTEFWNTLKNRADFTLTPVGKDPPVPKYLMRVEEYEKKELYDLIGIAKQIGLVKPDSRGEVLGISKNQLVKMIVEHDLEADK